MTVKPWSGRRVTRLIAITLQLKGTTCHLCGRAGADSADHDPPRSVLIASGCTNPDDPQLYLWPAHLLCNKRRRARPITDQLRAELLRRRLVDEGTTRATLSPRFARRRAEVADFLRGCDPAGSTPPGSIPGGAEKNG